MQAPPANQGRPVDRPEIDVVKAVAILFITNSHLDLLYPDARLSAGGMLGNLLFFLASGYGLALSLNDRSRFVPWLRRRLQRVYLPVLLVGLAALACMPAARNRPDLDAFGFFVWPTPYWFVSAIVIFYPLFYVFWRHFGRLARIAFSAALVLAYAYIYLAVLDLQQVSIDGAAGYFPWLFYLGVMLAGGALARHPELTLRRAGAWTLAFFAAWVAYKLLAPPLHLQSWQVLLHVAGAGFAGAAFFAARQVTAWRGYAYIAPVVLWLSAISFEVYLVQRAWVHSPWLLQAGWPWGWLAFWPLCLGTAWVFWRLGQRAHGGLGHLESRLLQPRT